MMISTKDLERRKPYFEMQSTAFSDACYQHFVYCPKKLSLEGTAGWHSKLCPLRTFAERTCFMAKTLMTSSAKELIP